VKKNVTQLKELAALHALGALDGADNSTFAKFLAESDEARREALGFALVTEALAGSLPMPAAPSPDLKVRILRRAESNKAKSSAESHLKRLVPQASNGMAFLKDVNSPGWVPLPVQGAFVKLLAFDEACNYAIVLGKLDPGARYPSHTHQHPEDLFMLTGDLHIGDEVIRAGDFHHADAGSRHGVNWSEQGCVLLAILSKDDLLNQLVLVR
jgi:anti-sigma factor ChrR (cupin superfamily)